eukprot:scaffold33284_cov69-Phaeocystis_antarctica.AAC.4
MSSRLVTSGAAHGCTASQADRVAPVEHPTSTTRLPRSAASWKATPASLSSAWQVASSRIMSPPRSCGATPCPVSRYLSRCARRPRAILRSTGLISCTLADQPWRKSTTTSVRVSRCPSNQSTAEPASGCSGAACSSLRRMKPSTSLIANPEGSWGGERPARNIPRRSSRKWSRMAAHTVRSATSRALRTSQMSMLSGLCSSVPGWSQLLLLTLLLLLLMLLLLLSP